jgi:hypothetical protein
VHVAFRKRAEKRASAAVMREVHTQFS